MVEISLDFQRFERDLWRGIGRKHITIWNLDGVASVVVPANSWPTVSDMQKRWVLQEKTEKQPSNFKNYKVLENLGFCVCKPQVFEQTLEKLRFWICKVYVYIYILINYP